jgi:hypothetical protein
VTLIAIDPGLKPGVVELDANGIVVRASHRIEPWALVSDWPVAVTEGQWMFRGSDVDPNDLFKLAFRAGFTLASVPAVRRMCLPPKVWRGATAANKQQVQNRILRTLSPTESALFKDIPKSRHGDVLDAIGIGRAALRLAPTTTEYDWSLTK